MVMFIFFQTLFELNSNLRNIKALGTDGEEGIMNSSLLCFESTATVHLLCSDHKKGNIERKLNELRAPETTSKHILADIFGRRTGSIKENGLIDSECASEFDKSCRDMKGACDHFVSGFHSWFIKYEAEFFKNTLYARSVIGQTLPEPSAITE